MYYIDIISDGEYAAGPVRVEFEDDAREEFSDMKLEAIDLSIEYPSEFSVRMYDDDDNILASTVYVDGKRIA